MEKVDVVEIDMERSGIAREWKTDLPDVYFLERIEWKDTTMLVRRNGPSLSDRIYMVYKHHTTVLDTTEAHACNLFVMEDSPLGPILPLIFEAVGPGKEFYEVHFCDGDVVHHMDDIPAEEFHSGEYIRNFVHDSIGDFVTDEILFNNVYEAKDYAASFVGEYEG